MIQKRLTHWLKNTLLIIFIIIIVFLAFLCCYYNAYTSIYDETTSIVYDNPFKIIVFFLITIIAFFWIRQKNILFKKLENKKLFTIFSILLISMATYVIFSHDIFPVSDQQEILYAASGLKNGDYSSFLPTGYVGRCTNQAGIVVILYYLSFILGDNNYHLIQFLNVFALLLGYYSLSEIVKLCFNNTELSKWTLVGLFIFVPLICYIVFVYGNIFGLSLSLFSVLNWYKYYKFRKIKYIILMLVSIFMAILFKSNYVIFWIGIVIFILIDAFLNKKIYSNLIFLLMIIIYLLSSIGPKYIIYAKSDIKLGKGIPMTAYIEMGLQDTPNKPGWFNLYNWNIYEINEHDSEKAEQQIAKDLTDTLTEYLNNPKEFLDFLYRKTITQWCNPDFQGTWIMRESNFYIYTDFYYNIYNIFQSIILFSTLAFLFMNWKSLTIKDLLIPTIFIGGFVFHLFWEAKGQYTITYFVLLIPYCAKGLMDMSDDIADGILTLKRNSSVLEIVRHFSKRNTVQYIVGLIVICLLITLLI